MEENGVPELQWPSKRIPQGGIFHNHPVKYTAETQKLMKVIMEESKLTLLQRKQVDWCLRSGGSLSQLQPSKMRGQSAYVVYRRPKTSRRRSFSAIKSSGDFERERYQPIHKNEDREVVKKRLQELMEFGKCEGPPLKSKFKIQKQPDTKLNTLPEDEEILHDLLVQIQEREEWLAEMEALGEGAKHREAIRDQIAERIRKIETLNLKHLQNGKYEEDGRKLKQQKSQGKPRRRQSAPISEVNICGGKSYPNTDEQLNASTSDIPSHYNLHKPHPDVSVMSIRKGSSSTASSFSGNKKPPAEKKLGQRLSADCHPSSKTSPQVEGLRIDCLARLGNKEDHGGRKLGARSTRPSPNDRVDKWSRGDGLNEESIAKMSLKCCSLAPAVRGQPGSKKCCGDSKKM